MAEPVTTLTDYLSALVIVLLVQMVALYCIYRSIEASLRGRSGAG